MTTSHRCNTSQFSFDSNFFIKSRRPTPSQICAQSVHRSGALLLCNAICKSLSPHTPQSTSIKSCSSLILASRLCSPLLNLFLFQIETGAYRRPPDMCFKIPQNSFPHFVASVQARIPSHAYVKSFQEFTEA